MTTTQARTTQLTISTAALAVFTLVVLTGCGGDESGISPASLTAPDLATTAGYQLTDGGDGGSGNGDPAAGLPPAGGETPAATSGIQAPVTGQALEVSQVVGKHGATLVAGRHTYRILPNALGGSVTVTLRDLTGVNGRVECQVLPPGLALSKPAHLTTQFADLMPAAGCTMFEVTGSGDPSEGWQVLGGDASAGGLKVHVSRTGNFAPGTAQ